MASPAKFNFVNPFSILAKQHSEGLDSVVTYINTNGVNVDNVVEGTLEYIASVYTDFASGQAQFGMKAIIANSINSYLDLGSRTPYLNSLQSIPFSGFTEYFERLNDSLRFSAKLDSAASKQQVVSILGAASHDYWKNIVKTPGNWSSYLTGNQAMDTACVAYWVDSAMFGANLNFKQLATQNAYSEYNNMVTSLAGSIAVSASKVILDIVPKILTKCCKTGKPEVSPEERAYFFDCSLNGEYSHTIEVEADSVSDATTSVNNATAGTGYSCTLNSSSVSQ